MKSELLFSLCALLTGALIPAQAAANATLSKSLGSVQVAALVLFCVGLLFVTVVILLGGGPRPPPAAFAAAPAYSYLGGLVVGTYVLAITYLTPRLGVGTAIAFIVTGQVVSAVLIDHFGLLGATVQRISISRVAGIGLITVGVYLARRVS